MAAPALALNLDVTVDTTNITAVLVMLDAFADCDAARGLLQFHDRDGSIIDAIRGWANDRSLAMVRVKNEIAGVRTFITYDVAIDTNRGVAVHDVRTDEWTEGAPIVDCTDGNWSPAQHAAISEVSR